MQESEGNRLELRLLKMLFKGAMLIEKAAKADHLLLSADHGTIAISNVVLTNLLRVKFIQHNGECDISLTDAGKELVKQMKNGGAVSSQNSAEMVQEFNVSESPLAALYRLKSSSGISFLCREEFEAGERLREDFTRACMMPSITSDWERYQYGMGRLTVYSELDISESAAAARRRVQSALEAVGPELNGLLLDICCFLKGIQTIERERNWPVRSGKIMLKTALSVLHRHYNPPSLSASRPSKLHWGTADYRPSL